MRFLLLGFRYGHEVATFKFGDTTKFNGDVVNKTVTIPDSASVELYPSPGKNFYPVMCDSFYLFAYTGTLENGSMSEWTTSQLVGPYKFQNSASGVSKNQILIRKRLKHEFPPQELIRSNSYIDNLLGRKVYHSSNFQMKATESSVIKIRLLDYLSHLSL